MIQRIKCLLGLHEYEDLRIFRSRAERNNTMSRKSKHKKRRIKTNYIQRIEIVCRTCGNKITFEP